MPTVFSFFRAIFFFFRRKECFWISKSKDLKKDQDGEKIGKKKKKKKSPVHISRFKKEQTKNLVI